MVESGNSLLVIMILLVPANVLLAEVGVFALSNELSELLLTFIGEEDNGILETTFTVLSPPVRNNQVR